MTDKQIIIDGIDVSGCPHYIDKDGSCSSHDCECIKCVHNVCFYKDYKAKEQECEELNKEIHNLNSTINFIKVTEHSAINKYNKFKKALTEIKNVIGDRNKEGEAFCDDRLYKIEQILQKCEVLDERKE